MLGPWPTRMAIPAARRMPPELAQTLPRYDLGDPEMTDWTTEGDEPVMTCDDPKCPSRRKCFFTGSQVFGGIVLDFHPRARARLATRILALDEGRLDLIGRWALLAAFACVMPYRTRSAAASFHCPIWTVDLQSAVNPSLTGHNLRSYRRCGAGIRGWRWSVLPLQAA